MRVPSLPLRKRDASRIPLGPHERTLRSGAQPRLRPDPSPPSAAIRPTRSTPRFTQGFSPEPAKAGAGLPDLVGLDTGLTPGQTDGMTVKVGISLPERTHARAVEHTRSMGTTLSGLIDAGVEERSVTAPSQGDVLISNPSPLTG